MTSRTRRRTPPDPLRVDTDVALAGAGLLILNDGAHFRGLIKAGGLGADTAPDSFRWRVER